MSDRESARSSRGRLIGLIRKLLRATVVLGALAAGLLLGVAIGLSGIDTPGHSFYVTDRMGRFLGEIGDADRDKLGYWPLERVPDRVAAATIALEDRRFHSHPGVDPLAILRAARQNGRSGRRISGASTLAMQVVRMQHPGPRSYPRKTVESLAAVAMTLRHGRDAVLRQYLTLAPYGNGVHGIAHAARCYFDKPVEDLSWAEIVFLSAVPQAPGRMNLLTRKGREDAIARGMRSLDRLRALGVIADDEFAMAARQLGEMRVAARRMRPDSTIHALEAIEADLAHIPDTTPVDPMIRTAIDLDVQSDLADLCYETVRDSESLGVGNTAAIVLERDTARIVAYIGSAGYFDHRRSGAIDYARVRRSSGSTLKPFLYALAYELDTINPGTILDDIVRGPGGISNSDEAYLGPLLPRTALANSRNVPAAELLGRVGLHRTMGFLRELSLNDPRHTAEYYGMGLAIGGLPVTLSNLVRACTVIACDGILKDPSFRAADLPSTGKRIVSSQTARLLTQHLADAQARLPTFPLMGTLDYPFPVAVKTGTSSAYRDSWTVAWSPDYIVGVWMGRPDGKPMQRVSGALGAAKLVRSIVLRLQDPDRARRGFDLPDGCVKVPICRISGKRATDCCTSVIDEWFREGQAPVDECRIHTRIAIDVRNGRRATAQTPARAIELRTYADLPGRYAHWAKSVGIPAVPDEFSILGEGISTALPQMAPAETLDSGPMDREIRIQIQSPADGMRVVSDPETPGAMATIGLIAVVEPRVPEIVWRVDGVEAARCRYPYSARWRITPGEHRIEAGLPDRRIVSNTVKIEVR